MLGNRKPDGSFDGNLVRSSTVVTLSMATMTFHRHGKRADLMFWHGRAEFAWRQVLIGPNNFQ